jgi:hypothetical protein
MSTELTRQETENSLISKENNLLEKFTTTAFHKITTRAGYEDFSLTTIDDARMNLISERMGEINRGLNAFAKTNTQFVSLALTLSEATPERNIRQIHAQLETKRGALSESQFRLLKQQNDLKRKILRRQEIVEATIGQGTKYPTAVHKELDLERIDIEIEETKSKMVDGRVHIEQAIKEIGMYQDAYDDIVEHFGLQNWDEVDMEESDVKYNLLRCFFQSLRSCRQIGHINEPNQEWLEQLGINPSFVQFEILAFLETERKVMQELLAKGGGFGDDMTAVEEFVGHLYEKYKQAPLEQIKKRGMTTHLYDKWSFKDQNKEATRQSSDPA